MPDTPDLAQFEQLFESTQNMIFSLGMRLFHDHEEALDFSQEVYLKAYDKFHTFENRSKASTWLYSLALNLGLNKLKRDKRLKNEIQKDTLDAGVAEQPWHKIFDPFESVSEDEFRKQLLDEVDDLPDTYRIPLFLYYYEKLSYEEIAKHLNIKVGTLKSNLHRGKLLLRQKLIDKGIIEEDQ